MTDNLMLQEWLSCPVCREDDQHVDDPDITIGLDHEHLVFQCNACGTALKRYHADYQLFPSPGDSVSR